MIIKFINLHIMIIIKKIIMLLEILSCNSQGCYFHIKIKKKLMKLISYGKGVLIFGVV
jgi:hypothetical protein